MTRTSEPTPTPTPVSDPAVQSLVRIVGVMAILCLCAIGYLMVKKSNDDAERAGRCIVHQISVDPGHYVPLECR